MHEFFSSIELGVIEKYIRTSEFGGNSELPVAIVRTTDDDLLWVPDTQDLNPDTVVMLAKVTNGETQLDQFTIVCI